MRSCWWPRVVVGNLPVGFASTHEQRKPGRTQGHGRKPQLEAEQSEVQRPGEDRGRQPSPLRPDWMPLCVGKRRTDRQISHPERPNAQAGSPPHQRHARSFPAERSIAAPRRTSTSEAQARSRAQRAGLAVRGYGQRRRGGSRLGGPSRPSGSSPQQLKSWRKTPLLSPRSFGRPRHTGRGTRTRPTCSKAALCGSSQKWP